MDIVNNQPTIRVNISILPFNEAKIVGAEPKALEGKKEESKQVIPEYDVPKTTQPPNFETKFDGEVFYSIPTTSG